MSEEQEFKTVNRKTVNDAKRNRRLANKKVYMEWADNIWPDMFIDFINSSMEAYANMQPRRSDETEAEYDERYNKANDAVIRKHGTCNKPIQECIDRGHSQCEERRQSAYRIYLGEQSCIQGLDTITYADEVPPPKVEVPEVVQKVEVVEKVKVEKPKKIKKVQVVEEVPEILVEETPIVLAPRVKKEKKVKEKTQDELDIEALCSQLESMPDKKGKKKK